MGISQGAQDSFILGRKIWKLRGHVQLVCVWGLHIPERQEQLVQVLREEDGSSSFQRDGETGSAPSMVSSSSHASARVLQR